MAKTALEEIGKDRKRLAGVGKEVKKTNKGSKWSNGERNRLSELFNMHDMEIYDVKRLGIHGGSIRVSACKKMKTSISSRFQIYSCSKGD